MTRLAVVRKMVAARFHFRSPRPFGAPLTDYIWDEAEQALIDRHPDAYAPFARRVVMDAHSDRNGCVAYEVSALVELPES